MIMEVAVVGYDAEAGSLGRGGLLS